ncbi:MAG: hypothetical protein NVS3B19_09400 [Ginsengibacter sp.]
MLYNYYMYTTYHLKSAEDINIDILNAIKTAFKERPIVLTIEEETDETAFLLSNKETKAMILKSISEDKNGQYISVPIPESE